MGLQQSKIQFSGTYLFVLNPGLGWALCFAPLCDSPPRGLCDDSGDSPIAADYRRGLDFSGICCRFCDFVQGCLGTAPDSGKNDPVKGRNLRASGANFGDNGGKTGAYPQRVFPVAGKSQRGVFPVAGKPQRRGCQASGEPERRICTAA